MAIFVAITLLMLLFITQFLPRLRFTLLTATMLFVLSLNHQAVATLRVQEGRAAHLKTSPRVAVVKQKVTFEATASLGPWLAPAVQAWLPAPMPAFWLRRAVARRAPQPRPSALPDFFRARLLGTALSPHAP